MRTTAYVVNSKQKITLFPLREAMEPPPPTRLSRRALQLLLPLGFHSQGGSLVGRRSFGRVQRSVPPAGADVSGVRIYHRRTGRCVVPRVYAVCHGVRSQPVREPAVSLFMIQTIVLHTPSHPPSAFPPSARCSHRATSRELLRGPWVRRQGVESAQLFFMVPSGPGCRIRSRFLVALQDTMVYDSLFDQSRGRG